MAQLIDFKNRFQMEIMLSIIVIPNVTLNLLIDSKRGLHDNDVQLLLNFIVNNSKNNFEYISISFYINVNSRIH